MTMITKRSALLKTSAASDLKWSGGVVSITGLPQFEAASLVSAKQLKYKAEVQQVVTVGGGSYTPTGATVYKLKLINPAFSREGVVAVPEKSYSYTTPVNITDLGATAALQREAIHAALVTRINADNRNFVTAATLGTGTGFTLTDDSGYYPARTNGASNGRKGATQVVVCENSDGTGWDSATNYTLTTAAVYGFGVGTRMNADTPVFYALTGNLVGGELAAPVASDGTYAATGQHYDAFAFQTLKISAIPTISGITGYALHELAVFVDRGTGSSTTNLAGFKAFERQVHKLIFSVYANDPKTVQEWFDKPIVFQDPLGAAPTGTANTLGWQLSPYGSLNRTNIGTQTIVAPVLSTNGLLIDQDDTAGEGNHTSANEAASGCQEFVVGQEAFSVTARVVMGDWTDSQILVGFRKKAVYTADYNNYTDLAAIGSGAAAGDTITTQGILNNAATVSTASAASFTDAVSASLEVFVDIDGNVSCYVDGVKYPVYSAGTTPLVLDAGDIMIPFYQHVNIGNGNPAVEISEFVAVNTDNWKIN